VGVYPRGKLVKGYLRLAWRAFVAVATILVDCKFKQNVDGEVGFGPEVGYAVTSLKMNHAPVTLVQFLGHVLRTLLRFGQVRA